VLTSERVPRYRLWVHGVGGDGMIVMAEHKNQGDLGATVTVRGVRASVGAMRPGNAGGAKGRRKVDA